MFHFRQISKVQIPKWTYSISAENRKICSVCRTVSSLTSSRRLQPASGKILGSVIAPASRSSFKCGSYFAHNRKYTSIRQASSASAEDADEYDYIIVGAGSAGCVLANRLSGSDQTTKVLLVEAGPPADRHWKVRMPAALMYCLKDPRYSWCYESVPQKHMDGRQLFHPRGKLLGGSSSVNAMVYVRGHAEDYNRWAFEEGATGWSYEECLPYFVKSESYELGPNKYRGSSGYLQVTRAKADNPLHSAFVEAGIQAGYPSTDDFCGAQMEGFGIYDRTISKGVRASTAAMYLRPAMKECESRLNVLTNSLVTCVTFDKQKATGIEYIKNGHAKRALATREVILSGGAVNSPQLLMLSGVGPADELQRHGIPLVHHLPGVGCNLQDHLEVFVQYRCTQPLTLYRYQWKFPLTMVRTGLQWFLTSTGAAASSHLETGAFVRSRPDVTFPDIQLHFLPSVIIDHGQKMGDFHAFQVHIGTMRATSRGQLTLQSADPIKAPILDFNYLSTEEDIRDLRACIPIARKVFAQRAFDEFRGDEVLPGSHVQSDADIDAFVRATAETAYHPSCTCRMGSPNNDDMVVVDPLCRVVGVERLRVVDASIMPSILSGNLNGPVIMLAEKAAALILGSVPLPSQSSSSS